MFAELLTRKLEGLCRLSAEQLSRLERHFLMLQRWNSVINLTSLHDPEEIIERHYCESIFLGLKLPQGMLRIADVGSGAGFPGIPVAILRPNCKVVLIEGRQRKAVFLREATRDISNVEVARQRAESVKERFDWMISRGVKISRLPVVADQVAVLAGVLVDPQYSWEQPMRLPWGDNRFLWIGHRVSRGTMSC